MGDTQIKKHKCPDELHHKTSSKTKNEIREVGQHQLKLLNMQKNKNGFFGHVLPYEKWRHFIKTQKWLWIGSK